jgi:hypothetical protein
MMQMTAMRASFFTVPRRLRQIRSEEGLNKTGVTTGVTVKISGSASKISPLKRQRRRRNN